MTVFEFCGVALVLIVMVAAVLLFWCMRAEQKEQSNKRNELAGRVFFLECELEELKQNQAKRLTHGVAAALEDLLSSQLNAKRLLDQAKSDYEAAEYWIDKIGEFGRGARGSEPYDPEKPNGGKVRRS